MSKKISICVMMMLFGTSAVYADSDTRSGFAGAVNKVAKNVSTGATNAWNATTGLFKHEKCAQKYANELLAKDNVVSVKLNTKDKTATEGNDNKTGKCVINKCKKGFVPTEDKLSCEKSDADCTDVAKEKDDKVDAAELKKGRCIITECAYGYAPSDDGDKCEKSEFTEESSQQRIDDLQKNADNMKAKEQSTANKTLSAASMGATGIGGQQLLSGLAEQNADEDAERDMKAYLATFVCDYGRGRNIKGGEISVELPGGNELITLRQEYVALAADLKARKEALGIAPGIESEVILDQATTGLYDNVGVGTTSGAYTSVARALMDENSADAAAWAKQKADAAQKIKTGAIIAGAGIIGGIAGNLAINSGKDKQNKVDEILHDSKYKKALASLPEPKCATYKHNGNALTGDYPKCDCGDDNSYFTIEDGCTECLGETRPGDGKCVCPDGTDPDPLGNCTDKVQQKCSLSGPYVDTNKCECKGYATKNSNETGCECNGGRKYVDSTDNECKMCDVDLTNGICSESIGTVEIAPVPTERMFKPGSAIFSDESASKNVLAELKSTLVQTAAQNIQTLNVCITGQTDPSQFKKGSEKNNNDLSAARAYRVAESLKNAGFNSVQYIGAGEVKTADASDKEEDRCEPDEKQTWVNCRRVRIVLTQQSCGDGFTPENTEPKNYKLYVM